MWKAFGAIYLGAQSCYRFQEDEKAWTVAVVQKVLDWGAGPANEENMIAWKNVLVQNQFVFRLSLIYEQ